MCKVVLQIGCTVTKSCDCGGRVLIVASMRSLGRREHHATASRGTRASIGGLRLVPVTILSTPMVANRKKSVVNDGEHMTGVALSCSADSQGVASGEMWQKEYVGRVPRRKP